MRYQYKFYPEKYFQLFFLLLLLTLSSLGNLQNLRFSHLTVDQGLSHTWVVDIIQDQYGFMWFATANGLNKYDGFNFEIYQHSQSDSSTIIHNFISHLFEDSRGNIWIGTPSGASRYNRNLDNFINYYSGTDSGSLGGTVVQTIIEDDQGTIWISTTGGLNAYNPESNRFTYYSYDDQEIRGFASSSSMGDMLVGPGGNIWIGTLGRGLTRFDKKTKTFTQFLLQNSDKLVHSNTSIESLAPCDDHHLWIGTHGNGLIKLDVTPGKEKPVKQYLNDVDNPLSIANNYIMSLQILADNKLWVGTENGGLDLFNPNNETFDHIKPMSNLAEGLNNGSIYSIYVDGQRNLWVGTYNGGVNVSFYSLQGMSVYRGVYGSTNSLDYNVVSCFLEDEKGNLWIGTDGGGLNYFNRSTGDFFAYTTQNSNLNSDAVLSISKSSNGEIWISTWGGGISRLDQKTGNFETYTHENGLLDDNILAIFQDSQNRLWVACFFNGIVKFDKTNGKHIYYTRQNTGLPLESVHLFEEDSQGNILIGSDEGFFVFDPRTESFKFYNDNLEKGKRLSSNGVFSLAIKNDETVWIGTTFGLNRFDRSSETFTHYFVEDGLPSNMIAGLIFDHRGYLWISTDKGLARMDTEAKKFRTYSIGDGLQGNQFYNRSHYITRNGELLFGGTNGFNLFHPDSLRENREKPSVVLTDLKIMNKKALIGPDKPIKQHITVADRIDLSYRQSVVSIGFAALSYDAPSQNQYAYMLEGFDQSWVYSGNRREVTYTNLPAGKYKFQVIASNKDDIWNTHGTSIDIVVHPPYWNTALFRIAMIILLIGISAAVPLLRIRGINKHNRELERRVKERTANLSAANSEIKALAYSISHDLRGPLRGINGYARIIEEDLGDNITKDIRDHLTKIQSASSRMSQLIDDLLNLSRILRVDLLTDSVNLSKIAEEIRESFQLTEPDRKVNFHIEPNLIVNGDKKLLRSAMENLIGNAWKFTRTKAVGEIEFGFASDPINAFYVRDNGVGFDMNFSNKLFRPFHRLHRDDEFEGTGIGLANVKRIIRRHNGNIWAESNVDQGATFYFQLDQSSMLIN